jgi:hypothetical protein
MCYVTKARNPVDLPYDWIVRVVHWLAIPRRETPNDFCNAPSFRFEVHIESTICGHWEGVLRYLIAERALRS